MNALGSLRTLLGYRREESASRLRVSLADLDTLESTPIRLLEGSSIALHVAACECRLDVVAEHVDGEAVFLNHEEGA